MENGPPYAWASSIRKWWDYSSAHNFLIASKCTLRSVFTLSRRLNERGRKAFACSEIAKPTQTEQNHIGSLHKYTNTKYRWNCTDVVTLQDAYNTKGFIAKVKYTYSEMVRRYGLMLHLNWIVNNGHCWRKSDSLDAKLPEILLLLYEEQEFNENIHGKNNC